jgi:hypothetical protein
VVSRPQVESAQVETQIRPNGPNLAPIAHRLVICDISTDRLLAHSSNLSEWQYRFGRWRPAAQPRTVRVVDSAQGVSRIDGVGDLRPVGRSDVSTRWTAELARPLRGRICMAVRPNSTPNGRRAGLGTPRAARPAPAPAPRAARPRAGAVRAVNGVPCAVRRPGSVGYGRWIATAGEYPKRRCSFRIPQGGNCDRVKVYGARRPVIPRFRSRAVRRQQEQVLQSHLLGATQERQ